MDLIHAKKVQRVSRLLRWSAQLLLILLPLGNALFWGMNGFPSLEGLLDFNLYPSFHHLTILPLKEYAPSVKFLGFLCVMIPIGMAMGAAYWLQRLFYFYEQLIFFSRETAVCLRKLGLIILIAQLLYPVYCMLISLTLTFSNPPGQRAIAVAFGLPQLAFTGVGLAILVIAWIMEEGVRLQEEQEGTI
jgi:hypothetical protein